MAQVLELVFPENKEPAREGYPVGLFVFLIAFIGVVLIVTRNQEPEKRVTLPYGFLLYETYQENKYNELFSAFTRTVQRSVNAPAEVV